MNFPATSRRYAHWWLDRCFLYAGRMTEAKGVPHILRAWIKLADELGSDCPPLWLVGGELQEIEAMRRSVDASTLATHEAAGRVKWWGYLDAPGISTLMLKAYVLVTHSLYEPGGRIILEAMAQGIPVIATPHGFAADLIADWHNGFLVVHGDEETLRRRLAHFALQPLLRHAMSAPAQQAASLALDQWNFMDTHIRVYEGAIRRRPDALFKDAERITTFTTSSPVPRGFGGVYPFEGETVDKSEAAAFFDRHGGQADAEPTELLMASGRSRLWVAVRGGRRWVIKHAFSTYKRRPMWDRGYGGRAVELQTQRVLGETLASACSGAAKLVAVDSNLGLILREWLEPVAFDKSVLPACAQLLRAFHQSPPTSINLESIRSRVDRDWHELSDREVSDELVALEADWQSERRSWHAWRPLSVRLGWRWLKLGLRRAWLSLPAGLERDVDVWINKESVIAANEERALSFGFCHGDSDPAHLRTDGNGQMVLIDCDRCHPGYFGHDWAGLVLITLNAAVDDAAAHATLREVLEHVESSLCPTWLLLSWLKLITVMRLCRAQALGETKAIGYGLRRLRRIHRITGRPSSFSR